MQLIERDKSNHGYMISESRVMGTVFLSTKAWMLRYHEKGSSFLVEIDVELVSSSVSRQHSTDAHGLLKMLKIFFIAYRHTERDCLWAPDQVIKTFNSSTYTYLCGRV